MTENVAVTIWAWIQNAQAFFGIVCVVAVAVFIVVVYFRCNKGKDE